MQHDAIAVIGVACRLPQSPDPDSFWHLLRSGRSAISDAPSDRRDTGYGGNGSSPGGTGTRAGGFLDRVDLFDAGFFNVSPREAAAMDPQQRLMLELNWEAIEDSGIVPERLQGSRTAVVVGAIWDGYATMTYDRAGQRCARTP